MLIRYAEIYENTEILNPIDRETWQIIGETCKLTQTSRVLELASGKGAFALYLAKRFGSQIDCFDRDPEFVEYSTKRAHELDLTQFARFTARKAEDIVVEPEVYDLGVCLGALYIFRDAGWKALMGGVKPGGYLAISDLFCKKVPPPRGLREVFFEEEGNPSLLRM